MPARYCRGNRKGPKLRVRELDDTRGDRQRGRVAYFVDETAHRFSVESEDRHAHCRVHSARCEWQQSQMQVQS